MTAGIVFPVLLGALFCQSGRPRLIRQAAFQAPADIHELLSDKHVVTTLGRTRPVMFNVPYAREVGVAIRRSWRLSIQVRRAVRVTRNAGRWVVQPLGKKHE